MDEIDYDMLLDIAKRNDMELHISRGTVTLIPKLPVPEDLALIAELDRMGDEEC